MKNITLAVVVNAFTELDVINESLLEVTKTTLLKRLGELDHAGNQQQKIEPPQCA